MYYYEKGPAAATPGTPGKKYFDFSRCAILSLLFGTGKQYYNRTAAANQAPAGSAVSPAGNTRTVISPADNVRNYINCRACGAILPTGSVVCSTCGATQYQPVPGSRTEYRQETQTASDRKKPSEALKKLFTIALIAVLGIVLLNWFSGDRLSGTTWKYTYDAGSYTLMSFSNGKLTISQVNLITGTHETDTATYKIHGDMIDFEPGSINNKWEIKGKQLIISKNGDTMILDRQ